MTMHETSDAPGQLWVELTPEELGLASRKATERLMGTVAARRSPAVAFAIFLAFGSLGMLAYRSAEAGLGWGSSAVPLLLIFGLSGLLALFRKRRLMTSLNAAQARRFGLSTEIDGITLQNERGEFRYRWEAIEGLETGAAGTVLHFKGYQALWLPTRAFPAEMARGRFIADVEAATRLKGSPLGEASCRLPRDGGEEATRRPLQDFLSNIRAGCLFLLCRPGATAHLRVSAGQFITLVSGSLALSLAWDLIRVGSPGMLNWYALPAILYGVPWLLLAPWAASLGERSRSPLAGAIALAALWLPIDFLSEVWRTLADDRGAPAWMDPAGGGYLIWLLAMGWGMIASMVALVRTLALPPEERMAAVLAVICLLALPSAVPMEESRLWIARPANHREEAREDYERRIRPAREEALYAQPRLLDEALAGIRPGHPGKPELFLLAVGGNGSQDVFKREVESVRQLFDERFGTAGHSLVLLNNPQTVLTQPVASVTALRRALDTMGRRMNQDEDVLLLFMTSHGSPNHRFDLSLWPYRFDELTPQVLRGLLDEAHIRYRVVVVSACYSGGFVPPLAGDDTLAISASRADRNSHGCSHEADWTFFGKAFFDEALRRDASFESAFATATRTVAEREKGEDLTPSEPQMASGPGIRRALGGIYNALPPIKQ